MAQFIGKHPAGPALAARCGNRDDAQEKSP
jgi:hypothetical protein